MKNLKMLFCFPFIALLIPVIVHAQAFNFAQDSWRFPPTEIDGTPIMRDGTMIEIPRCNDGDINSTCSLTFSLFDGGFVLDVQDSYFTEEVGSTYIFNLTIGQIVIPVVYLDGDPLTAVCDVDLSFANGVYVFNGIGQCPADLSIPSNVVGAVEWIQAPEGVTRERSTVFVHGGMLNPPPAVDGAAWALANPGDTFAVQ